MSIKPGSNWDESQQHEHAVPKAGAKASVNDGFEDSHPEGHHDSTQDVVDATVRKKSNPLVPKIMVGVMGLAVVGVLGFFGMRVMNTMGGNKTPQVAKVQKQISELPRPGAGTTIMGEPAKVEPAPIVVAVQPMAAPVAPIAPVAQATVAMIVPAVVAAPVFAAIPDGRLAQANDRARHLEEEVRTLREQLARQATANTEVARALPAKAAKVARAAAEPSLASDATPLRASRVHRAARVKTEKSDSPIITEVAEKETPIEISRLQLRGVFPRSGDDMQAWLMDGDKTRTVSKGDVINGAKVIRVETDRVVTDRGLIR